MSLKDLLQDLHRTKNVDKRRRNKANSLGITVDEYLFLVNNNLVNDFKGRDLSKFESFISFKKAFESGELIAKSATPRKDKPQVRLSYCESKDLVNKINEDLSVRHIIIPNEMCDNIEIISFDSEYWKQLMEETFDFGFGETVEKLEGLTPDVTISQDQLEPDTKHNKVKNDTITELKTSQGNSKNFVTNQKSNNPYVKAKAAAFQLFEGAKDVITQPNITINPGEFHDGLMKCITDPLMLEIEKKHAMTFGGYKAKPFKEWVNNVLELFQKTSFGSGNFDMQLLLDCCDELTEQLSGDEKLIPLTVDKSIEIIDKSANSGFPFFKSSWSSDPQILEYYRKEATSILDGKENMMNIPAILYKRVQPKGGDVKMRPIECPSKGEAIAAKCFTFPLTERMKSIPQFCGFNGGENVWKYIDHVYEYDNWISSDYSKFDATAADIMPYAFRVLKSLYPEYEEVLENFSNYYSHGSLITPVGLMKTKTRGHGLFSGGGFTSVIGTLVNAISHRYTLKKMRIGGEVLSFGDDVVIFTNEPFSPSLYSEYMSELGLICNPEKQEITSGEDKYFSFLGMYYHDKKRKELHDSNKSLEMLPTFPIMRLASGLYYREWMISSKNIDKRIEELRFYGADDNEIDSYRQSMVKIEESVGIFMKLNVARNHGDFIKVFDYVRNAFSHRLSSDLIAPFEHLAPMLRSHRSSRNFGLKKTAGIRLLWMLEGKDPSKLYEGYGIDMNDLQPYYSEEKILDILSSTTKI